MKPPSLDIFCVFFMTLADFPNRNPSSSLFYKLADVYDWHPVWILPDCVQSDCPLCKCMVMKLPCAL